MILDYNYHKKNHTFTISYVTENGGKRLLKYNVNRFKSYADSPSGEFTNWNGKPCTPRWTDKPGWAEFKTFIEELPETDRKLLFAKNNPRLYSFDIEVAYDPNVFPEPSVASWQIRTISVVNDRLDAIVLGVKKGIDEVKVQKMYHEWLESSEFVTKLGLPKPTFKYIQFDTEREMIEYFLKNIVARVAVIAGWNSLGFDWYYFQTRVKIFYPDLAFNCSSIDWTMGQKQIQNMKGEKIRLSTPNHTLVLDMMDIIGTFDMSMPIKESLSLDYIAFESIGMHKIEYEGDLEHLFKVDPDMYVFYNLIDSVLVQLIDKKFKTLTILYTQSLLCRNRISTAFSKIAITESMFFNHWFNQGIKIVPGDKFSGERGTLVGAYVRTPTPGKHRYVCCNDFASLYPSTIITCNLSIENYMGSLRDGTFVEADLEKYRQDPNYFVSVNGCVYKNDRDYAFKEIQFSLKKLRGVTKYLSKELDATVALDIEHLMKGKDPGNREYTGHVHDTLVELGFNITNANQLASVDFKELYRLLKAEILFMFSKEQAIKLIMNSMYGGSSHVAFEWFNIDLANDITGEARNLIHLMEEHIPDYFQKNWLKMTELHNMLGIKLKKVR